MTEKLTITKLKEFFEVDYPQNLDHPENLLSMLLVCQDYEDIEKISFMYDFSLTPEEELLLCEGYYCGKFVLKENIQKFLTDINFHSLARSLEENTEQCCFNAANKVVERVGTLSTDSMRCVSRISIKDIGRYTSLAILNFANDLIKFLRSERALKISLDSEELKILGTVFDPD